MKECPNCHSHEMVLFFPNISFLTHWFCLACHTMHPATDAEAEAEAELERRAEQQESEDYTDE